MDMKERWGPLQDRRDAPDDVGLLSLEVLNLKLLCL